MKNQTVSIYVRNAYYTPSNYYRIIQYSNKFPNKTIINEGLNNFFYQKYLKNRKKKNGLSKLVFNIFFYFLILLKLFYSLSRDIIFPPKTIIVSKSFCPKYTPVTIMMMLKLISLRSKIIWDFDDNILESKEISKLQWLLLETISTNIIVTNDYLSNMISPLNRYKVSKLPTTDSELYIENLHEINEKRKIDFENEVRIVWLGTSINLKWIEQVIEELNDLPFEEFHKKIRFIIICDQPLSLKISSEIISVENLKWKREEVKTILKKSHIGVMPLLNNSITKGKGGFKLIQYLSAGLPIIGSKVGYNLEIINDDVGVLVDEEWLQAIKKLSEKYEVWEEKSENAQKHWEKDFPSDKNLEFWLSII